MHIPYVGMASHFQNGQITGPVGSFCEAIFPSKWTDTSDTSDINLS